MEVLKDVKAALSTDENTWHARELLAELRKLLGETAKGGDGNEDTQKEENQEKEEQEGDK